MKKKPKRKARYPWDKAPPWANWAAKDYDGDSYWYETKPVRSRGYWRFPRDTVPRSQYLGWRSAVRGWDASLEARPVSARAAAQARVIAKKPKRKTVAKPKPEIEFMKAPTVRMVIWTQRYRPFIMGGDVNRPISCEVDAVGPFNLGKGFKGYVVSKPDGAFRIVESSSGGIIGDTIESVRADIKDGDLAFMKQQTHDGRQARARADLVDEKTFWAQMR